MNTTHTDPADEILCPCSGTSKAKIQSLIEQGLDMDAISRKTGAISGCGGCEWDVAELIHQYAQANNKDV